MSHKWYIVHAYSGFEKKVAASILEKAKTKNMEDLFDQIIVPTEEVVEVKKESVDDSKFNMTIPEGYKENNMILGN